MSALLIFTYFFTFSEDLTVFLYIQSFEECHFPEGMYPCPAPDGSIHYGESIKETEIVSLTTIISFGVKI